MRPKSLIPFKERRRLANKKYNSSHKGKNSNKLYRIKNRAHLNEIANVYYHENKKKVLAQHIAHHKKYKEHYYSYRKKWVKKLRGKMNACLGRIRRRCNSPNAHNYKYYGGRGILCNLTVDDLVFIWKRDNAHRLKHPSIDRIDNDGPYARSNCRFIEHSENISRNCGGRKKV